MEEIKTTQEEMDRVFVDGLIIGMKRHTWMKDGITYVGNGTYTLKEGIEKLKAEYTDLSFKIDERKDY